MARMRLATMTVLLVSVVCCTAIGVQDTSTSSPASSSTTQEPTPTSSIHEVFMPDDDPEVVFTGPLEESSGSLVVRYEPNSWYRESGIASLPTVGDLHWFLHTSDGCQVVDRAAFIDATGPGHEVRITPDPGGDISVGESLPLWIEGDWIIHDGCSRGDPIIP